ncbi:hypothetical protein [Kinneretia aquatilis]|uniref:hypothetical protein n=1 Tax=Kinneretia aquatilis TaxID=2070761 RepID=UPI001495257B|nr:hypothetical protein [Paucibacter aquatile]WIV98410.1 hypothetical protein K9V56_002545 [Paucibacter aquatile]
MPQTNTPIQSNVFPVTVQVVSDRSGQQSLMFTPDTVELSSERNALITYTLTSAGYHFPTDGSALVISGDNNEFPIAWYVDACNISLGDYNNNSASYKYTMTVVNSSNGSTITTDPTIKNNNE